ncbi:MAG: ABC transporter permease [Anaerolineales bacterium]|nr:ABC transporter permease [Anaerolineales bacterium]
MIRLKKWFEELKGYPTAVAGMVIIIGLLGLSAYAVISIPYEQAIRGWRGSNDVWYDHPRTARPVWYNWFTDTKLPETIDLSTDDEQVTRREEPTTAGAKDIIYEFPIEYPYDGFPQEISIFFNADYEAKQPFVSLEWLTPDGREVRVADFAVSSTHTYRFSLDEKLKRRLHGAPPHIGLFAEPQLLEEEGVARSLQGDYTLRLTALAFEEDTEVDAELVIYGQVHGIAGTDHLRRDLKVALLWGTPIAMAFGLLAAVGTTVTTMFIAAFGVWFSGIVDEIIQRITEVNLILPLLPILIMIGTFYSRSIWLMLGVIILLSIFGAAIKTYRAVFIQVRESPYIEAAQAYGAGNLRIIFMYLIPRIIPLLIPQLVTLIPTFVFLEASLAVIGLGDPILPTWGKLIQDAYQNGALYNNLFYWVIEPSVMLIITGLAFSMLGFALDRVFNPRLREL